jgi:DNA-binding IclR family transcriptional regulator
MAKPSPRKSSKSSPASPRSPIKSGEKIIRILELFSAGRSIISASDAAERLRTTPSTAYRYLAVLSQAGLVERVTGAGYTLGPAIIELDWRIRLSDRLLQASRASIRWLLDSAHPGVAVLLCRRFRDQVLCVHQECDDRFSGPLRYERGQPISMFSGAASKIILGHLPRQTARALYADPQRRIQIREGGLGANCQEFKARLQEMRRTGLCVSDGNHDQIGVAGPIFDRGRRVIGSVCIVLEHRSATDKLAARMGSLVHTAADEITATLSYPA